MKQQKERLQSFYDAYNFCSLVLIQQKNYSLSVRIQDIFDYNEIIHKENYSQSQKKEYFQFNQNSQQLQYPVQRQNEKNNVCIQEKDQQIFDREIQENQNENLIQNYDSILNKKKFKNKKNQEQKQIYKQQREIQNQYLQDQYQENQNQFDPQNLQQKLYKKYFQNYDNNFYMQQKQNTKQQKGMSCFIYNKLNDKIQKGLQNPIHLKNQKNKIKDNRQIIDLSNLSKQKIEQRQDTLGMVINNPKLHKNMYLLEDPEKFRKQLGKKPIKQKIDLTQFKQQKSQS